MSRRLHVAAFDNEHDLLRAAKACRELGLDLVDAVTPFPVHGIDEVLGIRRTRLPWVCLAGGVLGLTAGLWFQYWSSASSWPLDVGGKPFDSLPAFVPVGFEMLVLCAGLFTAFGLWLRCGLRPGRRPRRPVAGATDNRFCLLVSARDASVDERRIQAAFREHHAVESWEEMED